MLCVDSLSLFLSLTRSLQLNLILSLLFSLSFSLCSGFYHHKTKTAGKVFAISLTLQKLMDRLFRANPFADNDFDGS